MAIVDGTSSNDRLIGTETDDTLNGLSGNDTLIGSSGNDLLDGDDGDGDTADYSSLGEAITLERAGTVNKGSLGNDQILDIERIIGAEGQANAIDGSTGISGQTSFSINFDVKQLIVRDIPRLGDLTFRIENFVNATGTSQSDNIAGNSQDNRLSGGDSNDGITGASGNDTLIGGNGTDFLVGGGDADTLIGGLGEADNFRYNSINDSTPTSRDIIDFEADSDSITLSPIDADLSVEGNQAFAFIGSNPFNSSSSNGQVRYDAANNLIQAQAIGSDNLLEIESSVSFDSLSESDFIL